MVCFLLYLRTVVSADADTATVFWYGCKPCFTRANSFSYSYILLYKVPLIYAMKVKQYFGKNGLKLIV